MSKDERLATKGPTLEEFEKEFGKGNVRLSQMLKKMPALIKNSNFIAAWGKVSFKYKLIHKL